MESNLIFDKDANINGTHFLGYFYIDKKSINYMLQFDSSKYKYDPDSFNRSWTFENIVARIHNLSDQDIFNQGDEDKLSFELLGTYKKQPFTLYDWKGDKCVHIGGNDDLDVNGLKTELLELVKNAKPKSFITNCFYNGSQYSYK